MKKVDREKVQKGLGKINELGEEQLREIVALGKQIVQEEKTPEEMMSQALAEDRLVSIIDLKRREEEKNKNNSSNNTKDRTTKEEISTTELLERIAKLELQVEELTKRMVG